jgi:Na+/phosphate symporter
MSSDNLKSLIVNATLTVGILVILASAALALSYWCFSATQIAIAKELFNTVIPVVLLPMFNTLAASTLTFIFGKVIVDSIAARIKPS